MLNNMRSIDKRFRPHIEHLLTTSFSGSYFKPLLLREEQTSAPTIYREQNVCDHFKLHIPFAGYGLVWEVRFDSNCPELAPDFLFDDDAFTSFLNIDILCERVPSLENWDTENPECLKNVVQELLNLYTFYQIKRLEKDGSVLSDELSKLMQQHELRGDQIQVLSGDYPVIPHHYTGSTRPPHDSVSILFLQMEKLFNFDEWFGEIAIQFIIREYSANTALLHLGPVVRDMIGITECETPSFPKCEGLSSYFGTFLRLLRETLTKMNQNFEMRKEFHLGLAYELTGLDQITVVPHEIDSIFFISSSYMLEVDNYCVTLIVNTPRQCSKPKISLRTITGEKKDINPGCGWELQLVVEAIMNSLMDLKEG